MSATRYFILIVTYAVVTGQVKAKSWKIFDGRDGRVSISEERTIDCTTIHGKVPDQCTLIARNAKIPRDPNKYKCRREKMPVNSWNTLAQNSTTRLACPIGCEPDSNLSVLVKSPQNNPLCKKYYTYGKYRDKKEGEWYLWLAEPCRTNLTTWCRFKDIPLFTPKIQN